MRRVTALPPAAGKRDDRLWCQLAAGDGDHVSLRPNGAGRSGDIARTGFDGLRKGEQRGGVGGGDGTTVGKGDGDVGRRDVLWEFRNGEEIEASRGEKRGLDGAAQFFNGSADHGETILRILSQVSPRLIGETDLEAEIGHRGLASGRGETRGT